MTEKADRTLSEFAKSSMALADMLESDIPIGLIEQIFIENHIHILQSAYSSWQRRRTHR